MEEKQQNNVIVSQEFVEVTTPRGIIVRLGSYNKDIDELCVRASELIAFVEDLNGNKKAGSYIA